ncbi:hypothetical protein TruAng_000048 [Truncatella angustata]|nr:hypothetical protein TruAng_000048 [Truncatella angustata]
MAMNDATNLVSELLDKLSELEQKVEHHRQDMAHEFQKYSRDLLQNVSGDVSAQVEQAIKDSMHKYPALKPGLDQNNPISNESPSRQSQGPRLSQINTGNDRDRRTEGYHAQSKGGKASPPPLLPHTSGTPPDAKIEIEDGARSPHEREKEFQGLFTPSYLPLLESRDRNLSPVNRNPPPAPAPVPVLSLSTALPSSSDRTKELTKNSAKAEQPPPPAVPVSISVLRPHPIRRPTDEDTISSTTSDDSNSTRKPYRRSALRRSSSSSIKTESPRRVRFEVEGGEVLPTASPPLSPRVAEHHTLSPLANTTNLLNSLVEKEPVETAEVDEEGTLLGSSPPTMPRKVSSTDRLKAMARSSSEDTSNWAMVGNLQDMDEDEEVLVMGTRKKSNAAPVPTADGRAQDTAQHTLPETSGVTVEYVEDTKSEDQEQESFDEEDEDLLEMPALTSFKTRKRFSPPHSDTASDGRSKASQSVLTSNNTTERAPQKTRDSPSSGLRVAAPDDDELFEWEADEGDDDNIVQKKGEEKNVQPQKYIEEVDDEVEEESITPDAQGNAGSKLSTSPGIAITRPTPAPATGPTRHTKEAVGSYNGRPFTISSVKDQSILEKAAKMGDVYSFVGSVDGRSGVDESMSYRPDVTTFTGTPKSFSQRFMMEEFEESQRKSPTNGARG